MRPRRRPRPTNRVRVPLSHVDPARRAEAWASQRRLDAALERLR